MRKRGSGEGSIHKRADGRWVAIVDVGREGNKRRRKYIYGGTRREVQEQLTRVLRDQQQGRGTASERLTVEQFLARWLEEFVKKRRRAKTHASYAEMVRLYLAPGLGRHRLSRLSARRSMRFSIGSWRTVSQPGRCSTCTLSYGAPTAAR
jgi:integrase